MSNRHKILFHVTYFEQGQSLEQACAITRELGGDGIEFRGTGFGGTDVDFAFLDQISRVLEKYPLEWVSFGAPGVNLMMSDRQLRSREVANARKFYIEAARRFPLKLINARTGRLQHPDSALPVIEYHHHGSAIATEDQWSFAVEGYKELAEVATQAGFRFAFETHGLFLHDTVESTLKLIQQIDSSSVGMLWDQVNLMLFPSHPAPLDVVKAAGKHIFGVHLKNVLVPPEQFLAICDLEAGIVNIREQVKLLISAGYEGPWCIECPRSGDRQSFARKDINYLRQVLADCLGESSSG